MATWISHIEQPHLDNPWDADLESYREAQRLPEPESWQLEDFEDIVPCDHGPFDGEFDEITAYG